MEKVVHSFKDQGVHWASLSTGHSWAIRALGDSGEKKLLNKYGLG